MVNLMQKEPTMRTGTISAELEHVLTNLDKELELIRSSVCAYALSRETLEKLRASRQSLEKWRSEYRRKTSSH
jgi:hypothetical protein